MALSDWAGALKGLESGFNNYLKIMQIQRQDERDRLAEQRARQAEERALRMETRQEGMDQRSLTEWQQKQADYAKMNDPIIDASSVIAKYPHLSDEGRTVLSKAAATVGVDFSPEKKYSINDINRFYERLSKDPDLKYALYDDQRKTLQNNINALKSEIAAGQTEAGQQGGLSQYAQFDEKQRALKEMEGYLEGINARDDRYVKAQELKRGEKAEGRAEEKAARERKYEAAVINTPEEALAMYNETGDPKYKKQYDELKAYKLEDERIKAETSAKTWAGREDARQKAAEAAAAKTAKAQNIAATNKFYANLHKSTTERIKELREEDPVGNANSIAEYQKILGNIPEYQRVDILHVQQGNEPPNAKNLSANWQAGTQTAPPRNTSTPAKQPPAGARKAPDGNYYIPDPARPGKYLRWRG